ncbi:MAG: universal stress protein [Myxococcales bacterium]|nr:universal stress protein [Myxococcales bacterium]MDH3484412.1 universal stress protein [Myxococcales bacterium]
MQINQILVPTDFSQNANLALDYAIALAKQCSAKLHLLHTPVIPNYLLMDLSYSPGPEAVTRILNDAQEALDKQSQTIDEAGVEHFTVIREGTVHEVIRDYAKEHDVDLVVVGTHGRSGVSKFMYGSVTERVLKTVHTPIIVVPPKGGSVPSSIVIAYDFSAPSKRAAEVARGIHGVCHGSLHLVHSYLDVWGEYTDRGAVVGEAAEKRRQALHRGLEEMLKDDAKELFSIDAQAIQTHLVTGDPTAGILKVADTVGANLICAGTTGKSGIERLLIGSVARRLLHDSEIPLLLTHQEG